MAKFLGKHIYPTSDVLHKIHCNHWKKSCTAKRRERCSTSTLRIKNFSELKKDGCLKYCYHQAIGNICDEERRYKKKNTLHQVRMEVQCFFKSFQKKKFFILLNHSNGRNTACLTGSHAPSYPVWFAGSVRCAGWILL